MNNRFDVEIIQDIKNKNEKVIIDGHDISQFVSAVEYRGTPYHPELTLRFTPAVSIRFFGVADITALGRDVAQYAVIELPDAKGDAEVPITNIILKGREVGE